MMKQNIDLSNKCGSCTFGEPCSFSSRGEMSYIRCLHPEKHFRKPLQAVKQRTLKACSKYKPKTENTK